MNIKSIQLILRDNKSGSRELLEKLNNYLSEQTNNIIAHR